MKKFNIVYMFFASFFFFLKNEFNIRNKMYSSYLIYFIIKEDGVILEFFMIIFDEYFEFYIWDLFVSFSNDFYL